MDLIETDFHELRTVLNAELQKPESLSQAGIVKRYLPIILEYLEQGLLWEVILQALTKKGITLNLRSFQQTVYRLKKKQTPKYDNQSKLLKATTTETIVVKGCDEQKTAAPMAQKNENVVSGGASHSMSVPKAPAVSSEAETAKVSNGWELERQDDLIPAELLKKAFVEIDGKLIDVRQPRPAEFGDESEVTTDKVTPSSPNWKKYVERHERRVLFQRKMDSWRINFKAWLADQGFSDRKY